MKKTRKIISFLLLLFSLSSLIFFLSPLSKADSQKETILWYHNTEEWHTVPISELAQWCKNHSITAVAVYPSFNDTERTYLQNQGLKVYRIHCIYPDPPPENNNYTDWMNARLEEDQDYDGVIFDDSQNLWGIALLNETDQLENYQAFIDAADDILVPHFGEDNVILEMCIFSDTVNYTEMRKVNCSFTFSYYYPPIPLIHYRGSENVTDPNNPFFNYTLPLTNMSTNAWQLKKHYDIWGLNQYYSYEGWFWFEKPYNSTTMPTEMYLRTYNAIIYMSKYYKVNHLHFWCFDRIWNNTRLKMLIKSCAEAFLDGKELDVNAVYIFPFEDYYWTDNFDGMFSNSTSETWKNWTIYSDNENYTYNVQNGQLVISFNGTNSGWTSYRFRRLFATTELGLNISVRCTPVSWKSWKKIVVLGKTPHPESYGVTFNQGTSRQLTFIYRNMTDDDVPCEIGTWTENETYNINFQMGFFSTIVSIHSNNLNWSITLPNTVFLEDNPLELPNIRDNSITVYGVQIVDYIGDINDTFTSLKVDYVKINSTNVWTEDDLTYIGFFKYQISDFKLYYEVGLLQQSIDRLYMGILELYQYVYANSSLIIDCGTYPKPYSISGDYTDWTFNPDSHLLTITLKEKSPTRIETRWDIWLPVTLAMGILGLGMLVASPTYTFYKIKQREYSSAFCWGFLMFIIGIGLVIVWLWG